MSGPQAPARPARPRKKTSRKPLEEAVLAVLNDGEWHKFSELGGHFPKGMVDGGDSLHGLKRLKSLLRKLVVAGRLQAWGDDVENNVRLRARPENAVPADAQQEPAAVQEDSSPAVEPPAAATDGSGTPQAEPFLPRRTVPKGPAACKSGYSASTRPTSKRTRPRGTGAVFVDRPATSRRTFRDRAPLASRVGRLSPACSGSSSSWWRTGWPEAPAASSGPVLLPGSRHPRLPAVNDIRQLFGNGGLDDLLANHKPLRPDPALFLLVEAAMPLPPPVALLAVVPEQRVGPPDKSLADVWKA